jgi:hypothetical protein
MRVAIAILASIVFSGTATAASTRYAVHGIAIGTHLSFDSALHREYGCNPSDQFDGLTRCQKTRNDRERRGSYTEVYSILHSPDGKILYVNRSQEPAFFNPHEAEDDIRRYSRKIGASPRIMTMPHRSGVPDGTIAVWGKITLEQLDQESIKIVADEKGAQNELLIDFLGNVIRSARESLPIYRIEGGSGFLWAASFDEKGRGTLRLTAVDASGLLSPPPEQLGTRHSIEPESEQPETIKNLEIELATANETIAKLEKAKTDAEAARIEAAKARIDAKISKREIEQYIVAERTKLDGALARLEAHKLVDDVESNRWEAALYGSIGGLLIALTRSAVGLFVNRRKTGVCEPGATPVEAVTKSHALSPEIAISEVAFGGELEKQVASINATRYGASGQWRLLSRKPRSQLIWKSR